MKFVELELSAPKTAQYMNLKDPKVLSCHLVSVVHENATLAVAISIKSGYSRFMKGKGLHSVKLLKMSAPGYSASWPSRLSKVVLSSTSANLEVTIC